MKKKNIFAVSTMLALAVMGGGMLSSCTGDFENLNTNKTQVDPSDLPFSAQCAEPMEYCYPPQQNMFQFWTNLTIDLYGGYFMTPNGNFSNGDMGENRGHSGGMYENYYLHIFNNTRRIIADCNKKNQPGIAAVMSVVQAVGTMQATDAYGPLAYSSIINAESESTYRFDSQQQLYQSMLTDLNNALTAVKSMSESDKLILKSFDEWCGGDTQRWAQIINTMRLRIALRLSKRVDEMKATGFDLKQIATDAAVNTLAVSGKDVLIDKSLENEMWLMFNWGDCGFNANLTTIMSGFNDPRQPLYMSKNKGAIVDKNTNATTPMGSGYYGIRFASGLPGKPNYTANYSQWIDASNSLGVYAMPLPIFKAAESYFLLAEAKLRWGIGTESVQSLYEKGIRCSMENELSYRGKYAGITAYAPGDIDAYINGTTGQADFVNPGDATLNHAAMSSLCVKWDEGATNEQKLERIMTQKFLALFPLSNEAWAEQRRTGYPKFFPAYVDESNGAVNKEEGVRRVIYSSNAYDTNAEGIKGGIEILNQENTSKKGISGDKGGTHVWWDNANKGNF